MRLERVAELRREPSAKNDRITDGSVSQDGQWVVLRTSQALTFYRSAEFFAGEWRVAGQHTLEGLGEPQGEGVAFGSDNAVYLAGEGGGKKQPGTFARLSCTAGR